MLIHPFLGLFTSLAAVSANGKLEWIELVPQGTWMTSNVILGSRCQVTWRCATLAGLTPIGKENFGWLNPHCKRKLKRLKCLHRKKKLVRYLWLQYLRLSQIDKVQQKQISLSTLIKIPPTHLSLALFHASVQATTAYWCSMRAQHRGAKPYRYRIRRPFGIWNKSSQNYFWFLNLFNKLFFYRDSLFPGNCSPIRIGQHILPI